MAYQSYGGQQITGATSGVQALLDAYENAQRQHSGGLGSAFTEMQNIKRQIEDMGYQANGDGQGGLTLSGGPSGGGGGGGGASTGGGMPTAGSGFSGGSVNDLIAQTQAGYDKARADNEARYAAIRGGTDDVDAAQGGYKDLRERSLGYVDSMSNQQEMDARRQGQERWGQAQQGLYSAGMSGTTVAPTMKMGYDRETDAEVRRIQDQKMQQRLGVDYDTSNQQLKFMERRTDAYPNYMKYAEMLQKSGQFGGGSGTSGGMPTVFGRDDGTRKTNPYNNQTNTRFSKNSVSGLNRIWDRPQEGQTGYAGGGGHFAPDGSAWWQLSPEAWDNQQYGPSTGYIPDSALNTSGSLWDGSRNLV